MLFVQVVFKAWSGHTHTHTQSQSYPIYHASAIPPVWVELG